jgi:nitrate reductase NapAB chaperone NapD
VSSCHLSGNLLEYCYPRSLVLGEVEFVHTSGIVVVPVPDQYDLCRNALDTLSGIEVATGDQSANRLVAVLETDTIVEQEELLRSVQGLSSVALAELVCHHFGDGGSASNTA